ncbi:MAG: UDP-N-acetylmuramoyl-L-alanyl-D-glutamate--2,6-diaminopimelate ligase [Candidatus Levybacteria bacterium]|nr:UDP-N-acetylmuramoyl-L-alanyl-D-glutamate--2,6-diaminopimelate ligase [Candidatus Levybacteria bacterium]
MWQETKNIYHFFQAVLASIIYGFPANDLTVIGVTGTDGKTTTSSLIYHILKKAGYKTAVISTVSAIIDGKEYDTGFHVTTPSSFMIQSYLRKAKEAEVKYVVLEVTSHALDQYRVWGIPFKIGVLTNVTHEHLDYHKTYEEYLETKLKLLRMAEVAVVNRDDESFKKISNVKYQMSNIKWVTFGLHENADINPVTFSFKTKLIGDYNTYNILAAVAACQNLGFPDEVIRKAIADFTPPKGRAEVVYDDGFTVMVDFAHTPNSLSQILQTLRKELPKNARLIHVFGSAGERDAKKRPLMGRESSRFADIIFLTSEDPRSESPEKIMEEIAEGIDKEEYTNILYKAADRQEAINEAIKIARKGDVVLITGKGHEQSMNFGSGEVPWSDHEAVRKALGHLSYL